MHSLILFHVDAQRQRLDRRTTDVLDQERFPNNSYDSTPMTGLLLARPLPFVMTD